MSVEVTTSIVEGSGTLPKDVDLGSLVSFDASSNTGNTFEWAILTKPASSQAIIRSPIAAITRFGPLDTVGVYQVKLWINHGAYDQKTKILSVSVPGVKSALPTATNPEYKSSGMSGGVENPSFETAGSLAGYAEGWGVVDDLSILSGSRAGVERGRIVSVEFETTDGTYVMCLGDEDQYDDIASWSVGDVLSISQEMDLTDINVLRVQIKYIGG